MRRKESKRMTAMLAALVVAAGAVSSCVMGGEADAAAKLQLTKKKVTVEVGKSTKIAVKKAAKLKVRSTKWKISSKKVATVTKSGRFAVKVKAKKSGKATLTCQAKRGSKWTSLKCIVTVTAKKNVTPAPTSKTDVETPAPTQSDAEQTLQPSTEPEETPKATAKPTETPKATPSANPDSTYVLYKSADFENGTDGFVGRGGSEKLSSVSGGHTGKCLHVTGRTQNWHGASLDVTGSIVKGATYRLSAWVRQDSGADKSIKLSCTLDNTYPAVKEVSCKSGEWTYLEGTYEVPRGFQSLSFYFEGPGGTYDLYVDDVAIIQVSEGQPGVDVGTLASLKDTYKNIFPYFGTCLSYNTNWNQGFQLQNDTTMKFAQRQFSSFSLENEMKPEMIYNGYSGAPITIAAGKTRGYVIPDSYKEATVPQLNFDTVDKVLEIADKYGIKMRAHVLLWHQQTNPAFFRTGYTDSGALVSKEVMDARLEFYVKTVMKHVMEKEKTLSAKKAGSIVYCWDVVNEYIHRTNDPKSPSWVDVYGDMGLKPTYVKKAFSAAYDMLKEYGLQNDVTLFYNDYNEYDCADDIVSLVKYINEGEKANICGGIGMQSHITTQYPDLDKYGKALDKFLATGLEIQVTELDMGIEEGDTLQTQADKYRDLMTLLIQKHKNRNTAVNAKGITGVTVWGLLDTESWRSYSRPLLFGSSIDDPKDSFYAVVEAAG